MGEPAELTPLDRKTANELADLIWSQINEDESLPIIDDNRAWLLAGEIRLQRAEAELADAAWSTTCEAVDARAKEQAARIAELEEQVAIAEVNTTARVAELLACLEIAMRGWVRHSSNRVWGADEAERRQRCAKALGPDAMARVVEGFEYQGPVRHG